MANYTYGFRTSAGGYSDFAAQSMRLNLTGLPPLTLVNVFVTITSLSGSQTTQQIFSTGIYNFANARGVDVKIEPIYNDGYSPGSVTGSIQALTSGGSVLGSASLSSSVSVLQNVNYAKDDVGSGSANVLTGDSNNNRLIGLGGDDTLQGSLGADQMNGGDGGDTADYGLSNAAVTVTIGGSASGGHAQGDTLIGIENLWGSAYVDTLSGDGGSNWLEGNAGADTLNGNGGADFIGGGDGNDLLNGGTGADEMSGGNDNDTYVVDNVGDKVFEYNGGGTADLVQTSLTSCTLGSQVEMLQYTGGGSFTGTGNTLANTISGGSGNDILNGAGAADTLTGGGGADAFLFTTALGAGNVDIVIDFTVGVDQLQLDDAIFTGLSTGALAGAAFAQGTAAADSDDRIIYDSATGALYFDADGDGATAAVQFVTLQAGLTTLSASDFLVI